MTFRLTVLLILVAALSTDCKSDRTAQRSHVVIGSDIVSAAGDGVATDKIPGNPTVLPKTVIYKTNGDYNNNVAALYNSATSSFIAFPAPCDVSTASAPEPLADGWLLDRQGFIGPNTVFLKWTFQEYHNLDTVPSADRLRDDIIPDARVIAVEYLDSSPLPTTNRLR